jgi:hypothetical protein
MQYNVPALVVGCLCKENGFNKIVANNLAAVILSA